jgi:hypothetical protein
MINKGGEIKMKNERGSIIMVAIPLFAVLFISIGLYVYNSASHIERSLDMPNGYEISNYSNYIDDNDSDYDFEDEDTDDYSSYFDLDI